MRRGSATALVIVALTTSAAHADKVLGPDLGSVPGKVAHQPAVTYVGSDRSRLPKRYPEGDWVKLMGPLMSMQLVVEVLVNGTKAKAVVDTGASATVMSRPVAERLGVFEFGTITRQTQVMDAHGSTLDGVKVRIPGLTFGARLFPDVEVAVLGEHPSLFLIGADLLQKVDLYVAGDEGLVGLFRAGEGPVPKGAQAISLNRHRRQLRVEARAPSRSGKNVIVDLIVDTGASQSAIPARIGVNGRLPADIRFRQTTVALGGEQEHRGRFLLNPLLLGPEKVRVPRVLANPSVMEKGRGVGLLGNDVMLRHHTVISFGRGKMWLVPQPDRVSYRTRGPANATCLGPGRKATRCIDVRVAPRAPNVGGAAAVLPDRCLEVRVHPAYAGRTVELVLDLRDDQGVDLLGGGALKAYATVGDKGFSGCFGLRTHFARLGVTSSSALSLRWVRTEDLAWPCDPLDTECITLSGPFADGE